MKVSMVTTKYEDNKKTVETYETGLVPDIKQEEMFVVNLYPQITYQAWEGFGGALTESAGYTLAKMSPENYEKVVEAYYGKTGIGYNYGRIHMDSCDFSINNYCAVEDASDKEFKIFSLERDAKYVQPLIKKVYNICGEEVVLIISPWSPPAFMKTTETRNGGGRLKKECYEDWAKYICKYIKEYEKLGILIQKLTIQNEPLAVQTWDSCQYTSAEEKEFLKDYLYPEMKKQGLGHVGIYIWDHNKERVLERAIEILDSETKEMVEGIAFHWYSGDHFETIQMTKEMFPELKMMHSEGCVEYSKFSMRSELEHAQQYAHDIIGDMNAGTTSFIDWNIVLDEIGGPNHVGNYCGAPIMCDTVNDIVQYKLTYDYIGHFSKYIRPGAKRIGLSRYTDKLEMTAFKNEDGSIAAVFLNQTNKDIVFLLRISGMVTRLKAPKNSIGTIIIK